MKMRKRTKKVRTRSGMGQRRPMREKERNTKKGAVKTQT